MSPEHDARERAGRVDLRGQPTPWETMVRAAWIAEPDTHGPAGDLRYTGPQISRIGNEEYLNPCSWITTSLSPLNVQPQAYGA